MKVLKNNFLELKNNRFFVLVFLGILLFCQFILQYQEALWPKLYLMLAVIGIIVLLSLCRLNDTKKLARNALILIISMGILNALIMPIRYNLDENTHYYHALQIADGKFRTQNDEKDFLMISPDFLAITKLPSKAEYGSETNANLYDKEFLKLEHIRSDYSVVKKSEGGLKNPAYIPSAIGILVGRAISDKLFVSYYMGRIFNLLFYALLAYFAIKSSKKYKLQLFVIATIPYTIWNSAGYSYDSLYYGLILLLISQFTNLLSEEKSINFKSVLKYGMTAFGLILCKAPTALLGCLPVLLPKRYYKNTKSRIVTLLTIGATSFLAFLWLIQGTIIRFINTNILHVSTAAGRANNALGMGSGSRLLYFLSHPVYSIEMLLRSFSDVIATIAGSIEVPHPFFITSATLGTINLISFVIALFLISYLTKVDMERYMKILLIMMFIVITLAIIFAISGDPRVFELKDLHVSGVQGRYHYYILAFLPLLLSSGVKKILNNTDIENGELAKEGVTTLIVKMIFVVTFLNSSVALFGYL